MIFRTVIILVHCCLATSSSKPEIDCSDIPGKLRQIDAGVDRVFGVDDADKIYEYKRDKKIWVEMGGGLKHVTVGPSGVWGVTGANLIYQLVARKWVNVYGWLNQVDAGGQRVIAGTNKRSEIYCKGWRQGYSCAAVTSSWTHIPGGLMYYSCGPYGCWGVNRNHLIYLRMGVTPGKCSDTGFWRHISGSLAMVEVGTDGNVFGVNSKGLVYRRTGISPCLPAGTGWKRVRVPGTSKHVSYDKGQLWVISRNGRIQACTSESFTM